MKGNEYGVLKLGAVTNCRYIETENKALPADLEYRPNLEVHEGDLLFTRKNTHALVAACALVLKTSKKLMIPDLVFRLKIKDTNKLRPEYIWSVLTHPGMRSKVQKLASGAAGSMPNISKANLRTVEIPIPKNDPQIEYEKIWNIVQDMREKTEKSVREADALFASLSQRAFRGEL